MNVLKEILLNRWLSDKKYNFFGKLDENFRKCFSEFDSDEELLLACECEYSRDYYSKAGIALFTNKRLLLRVDEEIIVNILNEELKSFDLLRLIPPLVPSLTIYKLYTRYTQGQYFCFKVESLNDANVILDKIF